MNKISEKILDKIKQQHIIPKPRWQFLLKDYLIWAVFVIATIIGSLSVGIIIHLLVDFDWTAYKYLDKGFFEYFWKDMYCPQDGAHLEGFIIAPTLYKKYQNIHIQNMWNNMEDLLSECKKIIFLGYSLGDTDIYTRYIINKAMMKNKNNPRIEVYTGKSAKSRYKKDFGRMCFKPIFFDKFVGNL